MSTKKKWSMLGALGWEVFLPSEDVSPGGRTFPLIAWAWGSDGEVRAVICTRKGPTMLSRDEQDRADFRMVRLG